MQKQEILNQTDKCVSIKSNTIILLKNYLFRKSYCNTQCYHKVQCLSLFSHWKVLRNSLWFDKVAKTRIFATECSSSSLYIILLGISHHICNGNNFVYSYYVCTILLILYNLASNTRKTVSRETIAVLGIDVQATDSL